MRVESVRARAVRGGVWQGGVACIACVRVVQGIAGLC